MPPTSRLRVSPRRPPAFGHWRDRPAPGAAGIRPQGGSLPGALLAARRARRGPLPRLGAALGRHDQGRHLRPAPGPRPAWPAARVAGLDRCCCWASPRPCSACSGRWPSTTSSGCSPITAWRTSASSCWASASARSAPRYHQPGRGPARLRGRAAAHPQSCALQEPAVPRARAWWSTPPARGISTGWAGWPAGFRAPRSRSASAPLAIVGLPPLNGFVSEWLVFQGLLRAGMAADPMRVACRGRGGAGAHRRPGAGVLRQAVRHRLSGPDPRTKRCPRPPGAESGLVVWPQLVLGAACVAIGLAPGLVVRSPPGRPRARHGQRGGLRASSPGRGARPHRCPSLPPASLLLAG